MQHAEIERDGLIDRYVRNTLRAAERQAFEEHFIDCPQCLEHLEIETSLRQAIRESEAEAIPAVKGNSPAARPFGWWSWNWLQAGAAACMVITTVTSILFFQQMRSARSELASAQTAFEREAGIVRGLASPPEVYVLAQSRGSGEVREIALPQGPRWLVFSVEMDTSQFPSYRATLSDSTGREIWRQDGIHPAGPDVIGMAVPSSALAPGSYVLNITASGPVGGQTLNRFPLRIKND